MVNTDQESKITTSPLRRLFLCMPFQKKPKQRPHSDTPRTSASTGDETPRNPPNYKGEFERLFDYFDENGDGKISPSELRNCMRASAGQELSAEDAEAVVGSTDSDGDGLLGYEDFVKLVDVEGEEEKGRDLEEAFRAYVTEGGDRDCITPKSLRQALLRQLGESKSVEECKVMIRHFDLNGDGVLTFDEFRLMML